jgi:ribosomal protein S18 acetylase RimI-like enzyme
MKITIASLSEIEELQSISKNTFSETFAAQNSKDNLELFLQQAYNLETLGREISNPDSTFYLLHDDNELQGYMKLNRRHAQTEYQGDKAMEIERIYVLKLAQGLGYGKALLHKAIQVSRSENLPLLWLGVWEKNVSAIRFYEKHGFTPFGEHVFMLGADAQRDVLMKLEII